MVSPRSLLVSVMRDEGKYVLEWIAYHKAIGFDDVLIVSNNSYPGFVNLLARLAELGHIHHVDLDIPEGARPQPYSYAKMPEMEVYQAADWVIALDADEFLNVNVGARVLPDLLDALGEANAASLSWRVFGSGGLEAMPSQLTLDSFHRCSPKICPSYQAWAVKTLFKPALWGQPHVHRPRDPVDVTEIRWVNGSGEPLPEHLYEENFWRLGRKKQGYDLAQINHYALRAREDFLVKQVRGVGAGGGVRFDMQYWDDFDLNQSSDRGITWAVPAVRRRVRDMLADEEVHRLYRHNMRNFRRRLAVARGELEAAA